MKHSYQHVAILFPTTVDKGNASIITKIYNHLNVLKATIYFKIINMCEKETFLMQKYYTNIFNMLPNEYTRLFCVICLLYDQVAYSRPLVLYMQMATVIYCHLKQLYRDKGGWVTPNWQVKHPAMGRFLDTWSGFWGVSFHQWCKGCGQR